MEQKTELTKRCTSKETKGPHVGIMRRRGVSLKKIFFKGVNELHSK
jgi:hypothetical protein